MVLHFTPLFVFVTFWTGKFLVVRQEEREPFPGSFVLQI
jgi:hypothetical protein